MDGGESVLIEVDVQDDSGFERVSRAGDVIKAALTFDDAIERIRPAVTKVISKLRNVGERPDEISVAFGIRSRN